MASLGKIPVFFGEDYAYWKVRMRAFLQSMGAEIWILPRTRLTWCLPLGSLLFK
jgi:hypothetical protein